MLTLLLEFLGQINPDEIAPTPTPNSGFLTIDHPVVRILLDIIRGLAVLVVALILARFVKGWTIRALVRGRVNLNVGTLVGNLAQVGVAVVGVITAMRAFGVDWAGLLTVLGAAGLALSLSMQDLLKNVIAGVYMLVEQPFSIGDRISVQTVTGVVQGIELRTTILKTDENLQVVVPNSVVLNEIVTNRSVTDLDRQAVMVRIKRGSLIEMSREIDNALCDIPDVAATPTPVVAVERVSEGEADLRVEFWVPASKSVIVTAQVVEALQLRFPEANVTVLP